MNKDVIGVTDEVLDLFYQYSWPGNVRELKNVIEGAFNVISSGFANVSYAKSRPCLPFWQTGTAFLKQLKNVIEGAFNVISSHEISKENLPRYLTVSARRLRREGISISTVLRR